MVTWTLCGTLALMAAAETGESGGQLQFLVVGDWGWIPGQGVGNVSQIAVADQMAKTAAANNISFIISTGDNIYVRTFKAHIHQADARQSTRPRFP